MGYRKIFLLTYLLFTLCFFYGQDTKGSGFVVDKILVIIGDNIIMQSDIENVISDIKRQGGVLPESPHCELLEQEIIRKAMVMQAEIDSVVATDEEVEAEIENRIRYFINLYGGIDKLEEISGKNILQIKRSFIKPIRDNLSAQKFQNTLVNNITITPSEIKKYFNSIPTDSLPYFETEFEVGQIMKYIPTNPEVEEYTIMQLEEYKRAVESGTKKFEILAQLYSDDPGSKDNGGRYEINKNDQQWDPVFYTTCFRLKEGEISPVIKTKFGYHIIFLESKFGDDLVIRHILKIPKVQETEIKSTRLVMDSIREKLVNKKISFEVAVYKYSDDESSKFSGGYILSPQQSTIIYLDQMDPEMAKIISEMEQGEYTKPVFFIDQQGRAAFKIIYLKTKIPPHRESLELDYAKISEELIQFKRQNIIDEWIDKKLPELFLKVDSKYADCSEMIKKWVKMSKQRNVFTQ